MITFEKSLDMLSRKTSRNKQINPFFYNGIIIPDEYFCDREAETEKISDLLLNNNNIVLKSPRRLGKSSLIFHIFSQEKIRECFNTIYIDIYPTKTVDDFTQVFYKGIEACRTITNKKDLDEVEKRIKEISLSAEVTLAKGLKISGAQKFETLKNEKSLEVLFNFLSKTTKPNIVVIDEFQQIRNYDNSNIESSLRSLIQKCTNSHFIFSGSARHLLTDIFESPDKPFYRSCRSITLDIIPEENYSDFCIRQFETHSKSIERESIKLIYEICSGNTFMMQMIMNSLFQNTEKGDTAAIRQAIEAIETIIDEKSEDYKVFFHGLKVSHEKVLLCIADEGISNGILSEEKRRKYNLPASSTVANILKTFQSENSRVIEEIAPNCYRLEDRFMELWAAKYVFDKFESKIESAEELFEVEQALKAGKYPTK